MSEELRQLVSFISAYDGPEGGYSFFQQLNDFLSKVFGRTRLLIYSLAKEGEQGEPRLLWDSGEEPQHVAENSYRLSLGEREKQTLFALLECSYSMEYSTLEILQNFLNAQARRLRQMDSIRHLESLVYLDDVTQAFNRRKLLQDLDAAIEYHRNCQEEFALIFIDIDDFKRVNDRHGHQVGGQVLAEVCEVMKKVIRGGDLLYRYGGDEFIILLKGASSKVVDILGQRVVNAVSEAEFAGKGIKIRVSLGAACYPQQASCREEILAIADQMMYRNKRSKTLERNPLARR